MSEKLSDGFEGYCLGCRTIHEVDHHDKDGCAGHAVQVGTEDEYWFESCGEIVDPEALSRENAELRERVKELERWEREAVETLAPLTGTTPPYTLSEIVSDVAAIIQENGLYDFKPPETP